MSGRKPGVRGEAPVDVGAEAPSRSKIAMKKRSEETQTLRAGCSKAEPKIFAPPQTPSRGRRTAKI